MTSLASHFQNSHRSIAQEPCPSSDEMADCIAGVAPQALVRTVVDHCSRCPKCAQDWRTAKALLNRLEETPLLAPERFAPSPLAELHATSGSNEDQTEPPAAKRSSRPRAWIFASVTAAAALLLFWERSPQPSNIPDEIMRGSAELPSTPAGFHASNGTFQWPDFQRGSQYELSIFDASGQRLFTLDRTMETQQVLPQETMRELSRKGAAFWQVLAVGHRGTGYNAFSPTIPWPQ